MDAKEFLELLVPGQGYTLIATPNTGGKGWINTCHDSIASAISHVNALTFENKQAYFALATYKEKKVWNAAARNPSGEFGKWETRTQANALQIKSFFLDLDVDPTDTDKFASKADALAELKSFVKKIGLPKPMVVDSGGGIHAYWPFAQAVATATWRPVADAFKRICIHERFRADRSLTSDQARVLRCLGGYNFRRGHTVEMLAQCPQPYDFATLATVLETYVESNQVGSSMTRPAPAALIPGAPSAAGFEDNLGASNDPLHFDRITFGCPQMGIQAGVRGAGIGEKLWRAGLGIVKFCEPMDLSYRAISDGHPDYDESATLAKIANWRTGPTACDHFHTENPNTCEACPHWKNITSPAQLGRMIREADPIAVTVVDADGATTSVKIPKTPGDYAMRKGGGVILKSEDGDGNPSFDVVCPYDLYPIKILRQAGGDAQIDERSIWRAHLHRLGAVDMDIPQSMIADVRKLYGHLLAKGVHMSPDQGKATQLFMSAYLQALAAEADREKLYERMGWHDNNTSFVLGDRVLRRDGTNHAHIPSKAIRGATKEGAVAGGTLQGWKDAMQFYNRPGYEGHRFFIYAALGAPLFHMNDTGNKGVLVTASGDSGRGKTTCLKACASLWGQPEKLLINGNKDGSTMNALYSLLGTYHSLPFLWDDITERDSDELRRFLLNVSQGMGKIRMNAHAEVNEKIMEWATIVLASANTDDISRIMSSGKDVDPHLMRLVGVEFSSIDPTVESKIKADNMLRQLNQNYGHAGPIFMKQVVADYAGTANTYVANVAKVDRLLNSANASAERYWSAVVAAAYTAGKIACDAGLLAFPYEADLHWMISHLTKQRVSIRESSSSPTEILVEFMNDHTRDTLILTAKGSGNLDNVVRDPTGSLLIRHELDSRTIYVSRSAIMDHCTEIKTSFRKIETALENSGVLVQRNCQKVLGADTKWAKGQTRCWRLDASKLAGDLALVPATPAKIAAIGGKP